MIRRTFCGYEISITDDGVIFKTPLLEDKSYYIYYGIVVMENNCLRFVGSGKRYSCEAEVRRFKISLAYNNLIKEDELKKIVGENVLLTKSLFG